MKRRLFRTAAVIACMVALLLLAAPLALYQWGLALCDGRPDRPDAMATADEMVRTWKQAGGAGPVSITPMSPYGFFQRFIDAEYPAAPEEVLASGVARAYLLERGHPANMTAWHASVAALSIWLTRNWSAEELLTVASRKVGADPASGVKMPAIRI